MRGRLRLRPRGHGAGPHRAGTGSAGRRWARPSGPPGSAELRAVHVSPRSRRGHAPSGARGAGGYRAHPMIVTSAVSGYINSLRAQPDPVLEDMEEHAARDGIPIVVPETGILLQILALTHGARRIVEVGTAIGVSTLYLARALPPGGTIVSFEIDPHRHAEAGQYLERAGLASRADLRLQDAREGLEGLDGPFDMAFIDGVKTQYSDYLDALIPLLGPGAILAVDNVLLSGTVAEGRGNEYWTDERVADARAFNQRLLDDERFVSTITPVGDGVLLALRTDGAAE